MKKEKIRFMLLDDLIELEFEEIHANEQVESFKKIKDGNEIICHLSDNLVTIQVNGEKKYHPIGKRTSISEILDEILEVAL